MPASCGANVDERRRNSRTHGAARCPDVPGAPMEPSGIAIACSCLWAHIPMAMSSDLPVGFGYSQVSIAVTMFGTSNLFVLWFLCVLDQQIVVAIRTGYDLLFE